MDMDLKKKIVLPEKTQREILKFFLKTSILRIARQEREKKALSEIIGDALRLLRHFLEYGERYPADMAGLMMYDIIGFKYRLGQLRKAVEDGRER